MEDSNVPASRLQEAGAEAGSTSGEQSDFGKKISELTSMVTNFIGQNKTVPLSEPSDAPLVSGSNAGETKRDESRSTSGEDTVVMEKKIDELRALIEKATTAPGVPGNIIATGKNAFTASDINKMTKEEYTANREAIVTQRNKEIYEELPSWAKKAL